MSSDNFYLIRRDEDAFVVTMEFASDDDARPLVKDKDGNYAGGCTRVFADHAAAWEYADSEYAEYGVQDESGLSYAEGLQLELSRLRAAIRQRDWYIEHLEQELDEAKIPDRGRDRDGF